MADSFEDLGLRSELAEAALAAGYEAPAPLQRAAIPVLRRGGNALLEASAGAGVVGAYGLALLDRLAGAEEGGGATGPRALVLVPTDDVAVRTAESLARLARGAGLGVVALAPARPQRTRGAAVLVASLDAALEAVRRSLVKLEDVRAVVLDGADSLLSLGGEVLETLTSSLPREAQRVVVASEATPAVEDYLERHVRRPLRIPARSAEAERPGEPEGRVRYAVAAAGEKADVVARLAAAGELDRPAPVYCRTAVLADEAADALAVRGLRVGADGDVTMAFETPPPEGRAAVSYDVPFDGESLAERHAGGGVVLVEPRELPHLRRIVADARFALEAAPAAEPPPATDIEAFREELRRALREEDVAAQLLVLAPLFEQASPAEVAAAASALLRRRAPARAPATTAAAPVPSWVRLFISVGSRDNARPGDLVGAITGEAGVAGEAVGRIEIRDTFSIAEVRADAAERIIQALNGSTLRGRSVRVDYDRRATTPAPPRRTPPGRERRGPPR